MAAYVHKGPFGQGYRRRALIRDTSPQVLRRELHRAVWECLERDASVNELIDEVLRVLQLDLDEPGANVNFVSGKTKETP